MYFLSKRGLTFTCILTLFFSCGGNKIPVAEEIYTSNFAPKKAYVVIRSEGEPENVQRARNILAADFSENNVSTKYSLYRAKQAWNQNEIFNTAYKGQYDYIVLIDQVAKFTIDNRTQVGGKYQIRSYHIKSPNPDWLDLGQSTCNLSVVPSVQKFSREVIRSIVGNQAAFKGHDFEYDETITASTSENSDVNSSDLSKDLTSEIEMLRKELEEEKKRTRLAEQERIRLENQLKLEVEAQKQKTRIAQIEADDAALKKRQRQREIAEAYTAKREEIKKRETEEALSAPSVVEVKPSETTREERRTLREESKKRIAEEKEAKRRALAKAAEVKKEERRRLVELETQERKRLKEEFETQRKKKERLAEEDLKRIKAKVAEERRQAEELDRQKKEAERLAKENRKEEERQAEILEAQQKEQSRIEREKVEALAIQKQTERRIARQEEAKRQEEALKKQREEEKHQAELRLAELQKQEQERLAEETSKRKIQNAKKGVLNSTSIKPNAYVIIRGKKEDKKLFENLEDNIEFDFMFAKAKSKTTIFNKEQSTSAVKILPRLSDEHNIIILVDQKDYLSEGKYNYEIKVINKQSDSNWKIKSSQPYNLSNRSDLKRLSKKIAEHLSN